MYISSRQRLFSWQISLRPVSPVKIKEKEIIEKVSKKQKQWNTNWSLTIPPSIIERRNTCVTDRQNNKKVSTRKTNNSVQRATIRTNANDVEVLREKHVILESVMLVIGKNGIK